MNKYTRNYSNGCVLEVDLGYPKEWWEFDKDCSLVWDKIEMKRKMLSEYQRKIDELYNIAIDNVTKLWLTFFDKEKAVRHYENLQLYFKVGLKLEKIHRLLEFSQWQWLKPYIELKTQKRIEVGKNNDKDEQAFKLINNPVSGKIIEN